MRDRTPMLAGIGVVVALVGGFLFWTRGAHVVLNGKIQKVRTREIESGSSLAVVDFRFVNPSDYPFVVRSVDLYVEGGDGKTAEGMIVSEVDAKRLFQAIPELGPKYNDTLKVRDKISSRQGEDRMISARFEIPESALQSRRRLWIRVEEVDGGVSEIKEERK